MRLSSVVLLEGGDADGLAEGEEVTLKNWGNVKITKLDKDDGGESSQPSRSSLASAKVLLCSEALIRAFTAKSLFASYSVRKYYVDYFCTYRFLSGALRESDCCTLSLAPFVFVRVCALPALSPGKATKLSGEFIPNGDFKSTKKLTWLAKVTYCCTRILCIMYIHFLLAVFRC